MTPAEIGRRSPRRRITASRRLGGALPRAMEIASAIAIAAPKQDILARTKASIHAVCAQTGATAVTSSSPAPGPVAIASRGC